MEAYLYCLIVNFNKMKKLNKLQINSQKIMKNEELITLRGGYEANCCTCSNGGIMNAITAADCKSACADINLGYRWSCG